jgi:hypothetical protein
MSGWIKDYRKELESDIWMMPPLYHRVWQYLKYMANYSPAKIPLSDGSYVEVGPGQHMTSVRGIARGVSWYEGRVYREPNPKTIQKILDWLERAGMIEIDHGRGNTQTPGRGNGMYTLVTIVNWALYQGSEDEGVTVNTHEREQFVDINKKNKNIKKNIYTNILTDISIVDTPPETESETEPKPKFGDDHEATILTRLLAKLMLQNNPNARIPKAEKDAQKWIAEMERIHRLDGYSYDEIKQVIIWCQNDEFWKANILSTKKLREKMPTLVLQMRRKGNQPQGRSQSKYERTVSVLDRLYREAETNEQARSHQTH